MILRKLRGLVEASPAAAGLYRKIRDEVRASRVEYRPNRYGFVFGGHEEMAAGSFEEAETSFLISALQQSDVLVDIGANVGFYTCLGRHLQKRVISIEPLAENLRHLYRNLLANQWNDAEVYPVGVSHAPGLMPIYGGSTGASVVSGWAGTSQTYSTVVPVSTVDLLTAGRLTHQRVVVKIDVEGWEYQVLRGADALLTMTPKPVWLLEISLTENHPGGRNPHFRQTFERFWSAGYEAAVLPTLQRITAVDVDRWMALGRQDVGSQNFVFRHPGEAT